MTLCQRDQLVELKRLPQTGAVAVCLGDGRLVVAGHEDDRNAAPLQDVGDRERGLPGQVYVEKRSVQILVVRERLAGSQRRRGSDDQVPGFLQRFGDHLGDQHFVLDDQDAQVTELRFGKL